MLIKQQLETDSFMEYLKSDTWIGKTDPSIMTQGERLDAQYFHRCQRALDYFIKKSNTEKVNENTQNDQTDSERT